MCQRVRDQRLRQSRFVLLSQKTNKEGDNGARESDNPGGGALNPHPSIDPLQNQTS